MPALPHASSWRAAGRARGPVCERRVWLRAPRARLHRRRRAVPGARRRRPAPAKGADTLCRRGLFYSGEQAAQRAPAGLLPTDTDSRPARRRQELSFLSAAVTAPARPFVAVVGGSKVSSKIAVLESLLRKCDKLIIGCAAADRPPLPRPPRAALSRERRLTGRALTGVRAGAAWCSHSWPRAGCRSAPAWWRPTRSTPPASWRPWCRPAPGRALPHRPPSRPLQSSAFLCVHMCM